MHLYVTGAKSWQTLREGQQLFAYGGKAVCIRKLKVTCHKMGVTDYVTCSNRLIDDKYTCSGRSMQSCVKSSLQTVLMVLFDQEGI